MRSGGKRKLDFDAHFGRRCSRQQFASFLWADMREARPDRWRVRTDPSARIKRISAFPGAPAISHAAQTGKSGGHQFRVSPFSWHSWTGLEPDGITIRTGEISTQGFTGQLTSCQVSSEQ